MGRGAGELMLQMVLGPLCPGQFTVGQRKARWRTSGADAEQKCTKAGLASEA